MVISSVRLGFMKDIKTYMPSQIKDNKTLVDDWRILCAWYSTKRKGYPLAYSYEDIENASLLLLKEMKKRGIKLHPEKYVKYSLELYNKTVRRIKTKTLASVSHSGNEKGNNVKLTDLLNHFKSFYTKKPAVYLVGGIVNHGETKGDFDILIKSNNRNIPLEFRIYRQLPPELQSRCHFIYDNDNYGPFTNHIPLYDQFYEVKEPLKTEYMENHEEFVIKPFPFPCGKSFALKIIDKLIPDHTMYVEPFCGSAALFFSKDKVKQNVLADVNSDIIDTLKFIRDMTEEDKLKFKNKNWKPNYNLFEKLKHTKFNNQIDKVYRFLYIMHNSYMNNGRNFNKEKTGNMELFFSRLDIFKDKLKDVKIYNSDYKRVIQHFDSETTFFFLDPPYSDKETMLISGVSKLGKINYQELVDILSNIKGKFVLTHSDIPKIRKLFSKFNVKKYGVNLIGGSKKGIKRGNVLIITNTNKTEFQKVVSKEYKEQADKSKSEDKIVPFRFFYQQKGIKGYRKQEVYNIPGLIDVIKEQPDFYPAEVDEKFDGMRIQIHKVDDKVKMYSEDGSDLTDRFPSICAELKSWKYDVVLDCEITGWTEEYKKGRHLGRSEVSGYSHRKDEPDDKQFYVNVFDLLYTTPEGDIHKLPLSERRLHLEKKHTGDYIKIIEIKHVNNDKELEDAINYFRKQPGSEGAMIKSEKGIYQLDGMTKDWIKFKNESDIDSQILAIHHVKGTSAYNYACNIKDEYGNKVPVGICYNVAPKTLGMDRPLKVGEILRVAFVNLNRYVDPITNKVWFNWWAPRPIEWRDDLTEPDTTSVADDINVLTKSARNEKRTPKLFINLFKTKVTTFLIKSTDLPALPVLVTPYKKKKKKKEKFIDPFLIRPDENKKWRFVLQAHIRGRSVSDRTPIIIREKGNIKVIPIKEIAEKEGPIENKDVWTSNGWEKIKYFFEHERSDDLSRVFSQESMIEVTNDHSLFNDGKPIETKNLTTENKLEKIEFPKLSGNIDVDKDYAFLCGLFLAEGSCKNNGEVKITNTNKELLEKASFFLKKYGIQYHFWMDKKREKTFKNCWNLGFRFHSFRQFTVNGVHKEKERKSRWKIIPSFVFEWNKESLHSFVDGYLYGDGINYPKTIEYASSSQSLAQGILLILKNIYPEKGVTIRGQGDLIRISLIDMKHNRTIKERNRVRKIIPVTYKNNVGKNNPNYKNGKRVVNTSIKEETWFYSCNRKVYDIETESHSFLGGVGFIKAHNSVHLDDRRQISDTEGVGFTHFLEKGLSREPENFNDAKQLYYKEIHPLVLQHLKNPNMKLLSSEKAVIPIEWFDLEGEIKPGEIGATKYEWGNLIILDKGEIEYLTLKPYFHEYWYHGNIMKGKYVDRLLESKKEWKKVKDELYSWMFFYTKSIPYVISKRAVIDKEWMPPKGISALPKHIRDKIPIELQYWKSDKPLQTRLKLYNLIKNKKFKFQESLETVDFTLSKHWWRGHKITREGPSKEHYDLMFNFPKEKKLRRFILVKNPITTNKVVSFYRPTANKNLMNKEGSIPPKTLENPTIDTPSFMEIVDRGKVTVLEWSSMFVKIRIKGKQLIGLYDFKRESKDSEIWTFELTEIPEPTKVMNFSYREMTDREGKPYLQLSGIIFHAGTFNSLIFSKQVLQDSGFKPIKTENLSFVNLYHLKGKKPKVGILTKVWWDENKEWVCKQDGKTYKGAKMFESTITDPDTIQKIKNKELVNVSPEITYEGNPVVEWFDINDMALTDNPACKECGVTKACDESGCITLQP